MFSPAVTDDSETIYLLKRENLELRRAVSPLVAHAQRLVEGRMPNIPDEMRTHFHDLGDHLLRVNDYVESYESLLMTMLQASNARQGLQQNTDMRKMAAYAALLAVPTALAGHLRDELRAHARALLALRLPGGPAGDGNDPHADVPGVQAVEVAVRPGASGGVGQGLARTPVASRTRTRVPRLIR